MKSPHECTISYWRGCLTTRPYLQPSSPDIDVPEILKSRHPSKNLLLKFHLLSFFENLLGELSTIPLGVCSTHRYYKTPGGIVDYSPGRFSKMANKREFSEGFYCISSRDPKMTTDFPNFRESIDL